MRRFSCRNQFLAMAFAQLTYRESLRDIEACLRSRSELLYSLGFRREVARSTLAEANETRPWPIGRRRRWPNYLGLRSSVLSRGVHFKWLRV